MVGLAAEGEGSVPADLGRLSVPQVELERRHEQGKPSAGDQQLAVLGEGQPALQEPVELRQPQLSSRQQHRRADAGVFPAQAVHGPLHALQRALVQPWRLVHLASVVALTGGTSGVLQEVGVLELGRVVGQLGGQRPRNRRAGAKPVPLLPLPLGPGEHELEDPAGGQLPLARLDELGVRAQDTPLDRTDRRAVIADPPAELVLG
jgi:hypothetical protein